jgi:tetratricopeptide (TPR) repeat protein
MNAWGYRQVADGLRSCDELLLQHRGTSIEALVRTARALYLSLDGAHDEARAEMQRAQELYLEYGNELLAAASSLGAAYQEIAAGHPDVAERVAREAAERLKQFGDQGFYSTTIGMVAEAVYQQGRYDEAEEWAEAVAEAAMKNDYEPQITWRSVRGKVFARRGRFEEAKALALEAVEIASATDCHAEIGDAYSDLAEVLDLAGEMLEARAALERALEAYEKKGARWQIGVTRRRLEQIGA